MVEAPHADRARWLGILAQASTVELERFWATLEPEPTLDQMRRPEIGLVMLRGRAGGNGRRFNLGEMTVTRCAVRLPSGVIGHGYVQGRDKRKALLVAGLDALLQGDAAGRIARELIAPLAAGQEATRAAARARAAATKVEFFTLRRGEG